MTTPKRKPRRRIDRLRADRYRVAGAVGIVLAESIQRPRSNELRRSAKAARALLTAHGVSVHPDRDARRGLNAVADAAGIFASLVAGLLGEVDVGPDGVEGWIRRHVDEMQAAGFKLKLRGAWPTLPKPVATLPAVTPPTATADMKPAELPFTRRRLDAWRQDRDAIAAAFGVVLRHLLRSPHMERERRLWAGDSPALYESVRRCKGRRAAARYLVKHSREMLRKHGITMQRRPDLDDTYCHGQMVTETFTRFTAGVLGDLTYRQMGLGGHDFNADGVARWGGRRLMDMTNNGLEIEVRGIP